MSIHIDEEFGPIRVITQDDISKFLEDGRKAALQSNDMYISPLSDESIQGYVGDKVPKWNGVQEIKTVVDILHEAEVLCCMVAEPALIYYGTGRVMTEWIMSVPTKDLERATGLFNGRSEVFEPFRPSSLSRPEGLEHLYPRFKFVGLQLFFNLMSTTACHIQCAPAAIEYSFNRLPYPKLSVYAQSLLDTMNWVDLEDLIDGMDLTLEWGKECLDLHGAIDAQWGLWRAHVLHNGEARADEIPMWCHDPPKRLEAWANMVSDDAKKNRQGIKYSPAFKTRFRKYGQRDPRLGRRDCC